MHHHQWNPCGDRSHHVDFGRREARRSGLLLLEVRSRAPMPIQVQVAAAKKIAKLGRVERIGRSARRLRSAQPRSSRFYTRARKAATSKRCSPIWIFVSTCKSPNRNQAHGLASCMYPCCMHGFCRKWLLTAEKKPGSRSTFLTVSSCQTIES